MSKGQQRARSRAIQQRAEHKARRRRLRKDQIGIAAVASAALGLSVVAGAVPSARAAEGEPHLVKDIEAGPGSSTTYGPRAVLNGILYFAATDTFHGHELWRSDGTEAGTYLVKELEPGTDSSNNILGLAVLNDALFIGADNGLWKSDGTMAGTTLVTDEVSPGEVVSTGTMLYLSGYDSDGYELWKSDGTAVGTVLVKDIDEGDLGDGYGPQNLTAVGDTVYFSADDGVTGRELWKSNGTAGSTVRVKNIDPSSDGSYPRDLTPVGDTVYFVAHDGATGYELWRSNGTSAGTVLVRDIHTGTHDDEGQEIPNGSYIYDMAPIGDTIYFGATDGSQGSLWRSQGTAATTTAIAGTPDAVDIAAAGSMLYFAGIPGESTAGNYELWRSNTTAAGTALVKDLFPGTYLVGGATFQNSSYPENFSVAGTTLFFDAEDGSRGRELWAMDLNAPGTPPVPVGPSAACATATQSAASASGALAKAKAALKKAKKAHNAAKVKKAKKKVKKAKKKVASTAATKSAACG